MDRNKIAKKTCSYLTLFAFILTQNVINPKFIQAASISPTPASQAFHLPSEIGFVSESWKGEVLFKDKEKTIVHIQDAHMDPYAQKNIAKIIHFVQNYLKRHYPNRIEDKIFVAVEGAEGEVFTGYYRNLPDKEIRNHTTDYFLTKGELTGPEFQAIVGAVPIEVYGVETKDLYLKHKENFLLCQTSKASIEKFIQNLKNNETVLLDQHVNENAGHFLKEKNNFFQGKTSLENYTSILSELSDQHKIILENKFPQLSLIQKMFSAQSQINFESVHQEKAQLLNELHRLLPKDELKHLVKQVLEERLGRVQALQYHHYLIGFLDDQSLKKKDYPQLIRYTDLLNIMEGLDQTLISENINRLEDVLIQVLFQSSKEKEILIFLNQVSLLEKLIHLHMNRTELSQYQEQDVDQSYFRKFIDQYQLSGINDIPLIEETVKPFLQFYSLAEERDVALAQNTIRAMDKRDRRLAVLLTGGFHSRGLLRQFKEQGLAYLVLTPQSKGFDERTEEIYQARMRGELAGLEEALRFGRESLHQGSLLKPLTGDPKLNENIMALMRSAFTVTAVADAFVRGKGADALRSYYMMQSSKHPELAEISFFQQDIDVGDSKLVLAKVGEQVFVFRFYKGTADQNEFKTARVLERAEIPGYKFDIIDPSSLDMSLFGADAIEFIYEDFFRGDEIYDSAFPEERVYELFKGKPFRKLAQGSQSRVYAFASHVLKIPYTGLSLNAAERNALQGNRVLRYIYARFNFYFGETSWAGEAKLFGKYILNLFRKRDTVDAENNLNSYRLGQVRLSGLVLPFRIVEKNKFQIVTDAFIETLASFTKRGEEQKEAILQKRAENTVSQVLKELIDDEDFDGAKSLIRGAVEFQPVLWRRGIVDRDFGNLLNNLEVGGDEGFRIIDVGSLSDSLDDATNFLADRALFAKDVREALDEGMSIEDIARSIFPHYSRKVWSLPVTILSFHQSRVDPDVSRALIYELVSSIERVFRLDSLESQWERDLEPGPWKLPKTAPSEIEVLEQADTIRAIMDAIEPADFEEIPFEEVKSFEPGFEHERANLVIEEGKIKIIRSLWGKIRGDPEAQRILRRHEYVENSLIPHLVASGTITPTPGLSFHAIASQLDAQLEGIPLHALMRHTLLSMRNDELAAIEQTHVNDPEGRIYRAARNILGERIIKKSINLKGKKTIGARDREAIQKALLHREGRADDSPIMVKEAIHSIYRIDIDPENIEIIDVELFSDEGRIKRVYKVDVQERAPGVTKRNFTFLLKVYRPLEAVPVVLHPRLSKEIRERNKRAVFPLRAAGLHPGVGPDFEVTLREGEVVPVHTEGLVLDGHTVGEIIDELRRKKTSGEITRDEFETQLRDVYRYFVVAMLQMWLVLGGRYIEDPTFLNVMFQGAFEEGYRSVFIDLDLLTDSPVPLAKVLEEISWRVRSPRMDDDFDFDSILGDALVDIFGHDEARRLIRQMIKTEIPSLIVAAEGEWDPPNPGRPPFHDELAEDLKSYLEEGETTYAKIPLPGFAKDHPIPAEEVEDPKHEWINPVVLGRFQDMARQFYIMHRLAFQRDISEPWSPLGLKEEAIVIVDNLTSARINVEQAQSLEKEAGIGVRRDSPIVAEYHPYKKRVKNVQNVSRTDIRESYGILYGKIRAILDSRDEPVVVRIGGRRGVGKSTLADSISRWGLGQIGVDDIAVIHTDRADEDLTEIIETKKKAGKKLILVEGSQSLKGQGNLFKTDVEPIHADIEVFMEVHEDVRVARLHHEVQAQVNTWIREVEIEIGFSSLEIRKKAQEYLPERARNAVFEILDDDQEEPDEDVRISLAKKLLLRHLRVLQVERISSMFELIRMESFIYRYSVDQERATADIIIKNDFMQSEFGVHQQGALLHLRTLLEDGVSTFYDGRVEEIIPILVELFKNYGDNLHVLLIEDMIQEVLGIEDLFSGLTKPALEKRIAQFLVKERDFIPFISLLEAGILKLPISVLMSTRKPMGQRDISKAEKNNLLRGLATGGRIRSMNLKEMEARGIKEVLESRGPPEPFAEEHAKIKHAILSGEAVELSKPIKGFEKFTHARVKVHVVNLKDLRAFQTGSRGYGPIYEFNFVRREGQELAIHVYVTEAFLKDNLKKPSVVTQAIVHPLVEKILGRYHVEAVLHEAFYNRSNGRVIDALATEEPHPFTASGPFSDFSEYLLEESFREGQWRYLNARRGDYTFARDRYPDMEDPDSVQRWAEWMSVEVSRVSNNLYNLRNRVKEVKSNNAYQDIEFYPGRVTIGGEHFLVGIRGNDFLAFHLTLKGITSELLDRAASEFEDRFKTRHYNVDVMNRDEFFRAIRYQYEEHQIREIFRYKLFDFAGARPYRDSWEDLSGEASEDLRQAHRVLRHYNIGQINVLADTPGEVAEHGSSVIVETTTGRYVLRPISSKVHPRLVPDARFQVSLQRYKHNLGLPVPELIPRVIPDDVTSDIEEDRYYVLYNGKAYTLDRYIEGEVINPEIVTSVHRHALSKALGRDHRLMREHPFAQVGHRDFRKIHDFSELRGRLTILHSKILAKQHDDPTYRYTRGERLLLHGAPKILEHMAKVVSRDSPLSLYSNLPRTYVHGDFGFDKAVFQKGEASQVLGYYDFRDSRSEIRLYDLFRGLFKKTDKRGFNIRELWNVIEAYQEEELLTENEFDAMPEVTRAVILEIILRDLLEYEKLTERLKHDLEDIPVEERAVYLLDQEKVVYDRVQQYLKVLDDIDKKIEDGSFETLKALAYKGETTSIFVNATRELQEVVHELQDEIAIDQDMLWHLAKPERVEWFNFSVPMDDGRMETFEGGRSLHNTAKGPGKGGERFHPSVTKDMVMGLSSEMTWKTSIFDLPYGGGKAGIKIDPRRYSKTELARISRALFRELTQRGMVGPDKDIPAPDFNTNPEIMSWQVDEYIRFQVEQGTLSLGDDGLELLRQIRPERFDQDHIFLDPIWIRDHLDELAAMEGATPVIAKIRAAVNLDDPPYDPELGGYIDITGVLTQAELEVLYRKDTYDLEKDPFIVGHWSAATPYLNAFVRYMREYPADQEKPEGFGKELAVLTAKPVGKGGAPGRTEATGWGIFVATRSAMRNIFSKDLKGVSISLQGFGNVASYAAKFLYEAGAKVIRISVWDPALRKAVAIENMEGLHIPELIDFVKKHGTVRGFSGAKGIDPDEVITGEVDVFIPAALGGVITAEVASRMKAKVVVEAANGPTTSDGDKVLNGEEVVDSEGHIFKREGIIHVIPDILANGAGVAGSFFEWYQNRHLEHWDINTMLVRLEERMEQSIRHIYEIVRRKNVSFRRAAFIYAVREVVKAEIVRQHRPKSPVTTKKVMGEENLTIMEQGQMRQILETQETFKLELEQLGELGVVDVVNNRAPPEDEIKEENSIKLQHEKIAKALLTGEVIDLDNPISPWDNPGRNLNRARVEVHVVPLGIDKGFKISSRERPYYEWTDVEEDEGVALIKIYVTRAFTRDDTVSAHALTQALIHPLVEKIAGRTHIEAVQHEAYYQENEEERLEAQHESRVLSDLSQWIIDERYREGDWNFLRQMTRQWKFDYKTYRGKIEERDFRIVKSNAFAVAEKVTDHVKNLIKDDDEMMETILSESPKEEALDFFKIFLKDQNINISDNAWQAFFSNPHFKSDWINRIVQMPIIPVNVRKEAIRKYQAYKKQVYHENRININFDPELAETRDLNHLFVLDAIDQFPGWARTQGVDALNQLQRRRIPEFLLPIFIGLRRFQNRPQWLSSFVDRMIPQALEIKIRSSQDAVEIALARLPIRVVGPEQKAPIVIRGGEIRVSASVHELGVEAFYQKFYLTLYRDFQQRMHQEKALAHSRVSQVNRKETIQVDSSVLSIMGGADRLSEWFNEIKEVMGDESIPYTFADFKEALDQGDFRFLMAESNSMGIAVNDQGVITSHVVNTQDLDANPVLNEGMVLMDYSIVDFMLTQADLHSDEAKEVYWRMAFSVLFEGVHRSKMGTLGSVHIPQIREELMNGKRIQNPTLRREVTSIFGDIQTLRTSMQFVSDQLDKIDFDDYDKVIFDVNRVKFIGMKDEQVEVQHDLQADDTGAFYNMALELRDLGIKTVELDLMGEGNRENVGLWMKKIMMGVQFRSLGTEGRVLINSTLQESTLVMREGNILRLTPFPLGPITSGIDSADQLRRADRAVSSSA